MTNPTESIVGPDPARELLRHTVATVAYRGGKAVRDTPAGFGEFQPGSGMRAPGEILAHIGDLYDWAYSIAVGQRTWHNSKPLPWPLEVERFFAALKKFDDFLASTEPVQAPLGQLFQGPIADSLTHIGQIALQRRMAGSAIKGESYFDAEISTGRVGADQATPRREF